MTGVQPDDETVPRPATPGRGTPATPPSERPVVPGAGPVAGPVAVDATGGWPPVDEPARDGDGRVADAAGPDTEPEPEDTRSTHERLLSRLLPAEAIGFAATRRERLVGWAWSIAVTVFAAVLRFPGLGRPHELVFDETYYVKDAWSLLVHGYEANWSQDPNAQFAAGDTSGLQTSAEYFVHPQLGKWLIAWGIQLGGGVGSSAAWRLSAAVFGTLAVLLIARIARRLFSSNAWGVVAGLLLAVDGEAVVMSRVSLLDPFLMFFVLAAFGCLLLDREQSRRLLAARTAAMLDAGRELGWGPWLGWRWWRLAAAVLLGLACGVKWSGLYFFAVFGLLSVAWDLTARRAVGVRDWPLAGLVKDGLVAGVTMTGIVLVTYLGTWWSWFTHDGGWGRTWAADNPGQGVQWLPPALRSLLKFHQDMWAFHNGLESPHSYAAHPLGWIVQWRPTSFFYPPEISGLTGQEAIDACGASQCSQAITSLGNPLLWWAGAAALLVAVVWLVRYRDWRAAAVLSGIVAGWLPWFAYAHRTIFTFYSIAFTPWVVLTLVYVMTLVVGPPDPDHPRGRRRAVIGVGALVAAIVGVGLYFYPIWAAWVVPWTFWHGHMWLQSWV